MPMLSPHPVSTQGSLSPVLAMLQDVPARAGASTGRLTNSWPSDAIADLAFLIALPKCLQPDCCACPKCPG